MPLTSLPTTTVCFLVLAQLAVAAPRRDRTVDWKDLPSAVANRLVIVALSDGSRLYGKGVGTQGDDLIVAVTRSSKRSQYPKGRTLVPRSKISFINVVFRDTASKRGSAIGVGVGVAGVAPVAYRIGSSSYGGAGAAIAVLAGGAVVGWLIGHHFDGPSGERILIAAGN